MKYEKGTFNIIPNKDLIKGKPAEMQSIFFWLCDHADKNGKCYPAKRTLAKEAGCGLKSLEKYTQQLIDEGFITKELRRKPNTKEMMSNMYQILIKEIPPLENDVTPPLKNDTVTIPNINNTHLTVIPDDTSDHEIDVIPNQEETLDLGKLPDRFGETYLERLINVYRRLWMSKYGTEYHITSYARYGAILKRLMASHSEIQIASLMITHFNWHGASGKDEKEYNYISDKGFPIELIPTKINIYIAYLTNTLGIDYNTPIQIREYVAKKIKELER